ncbi:hypothetical protein [Paraburkholderia jirisanensis]
MIIRSILTAFCATVAIFTSVGSASKAVAVGWNTRKTEQEKRLAACFVDNNVKELMMPVK